MADEGGRAAGGRPLLHGPGRGLRQYIRSHHRSWLVSTIARAAEKYLRAYYNEGFYEFDLNGERFALDALRRHLGDVPLCVWDVGAHTGSWARLVRAQFPQAQVQSFEIVPATADAYAANLAGEDWAVLHRLGLSDSEGEVEVTWNTGCDTTSAISFRSGVPFGGDLQVVSCRISTIDTLLGEGVPPPDFLKIDTEGHDAAVLRGGSGLLHGERAPRMIQFEYGETWIPAAETLERTHALLTGAGYAVGRLYPDHVDFAAYAYRDDHFRMGNMVAVKDDGLRRILAG